MKQSTVPPDTSRTGAPAPGTAWVDVPRDRLPVWALVLDAEGIEYRAVSRPEGWSLALRTSDVERALRSIAAYERENPIAEARATPVGPFARLYVGLLSAATLVFFFVFAPPTNDPDTRFSAGVALAGAIRHGEIWRTVTALTLHADMLHLASNVVGISLFGALLASMAGPGTALALMLASGAVGNWLDAVVRPEWHAAVGASTAVFGAVGGMVGIRLVEAPGGRSVLSRVWGPLAAGLLLLALLGTSPYADVGAHVLGFVAGCVLGGLAAGNLRRLEGRGRQAALAGATIAAIALSWWLALR